MPKTFKNILLATLLVVTGVGAVVGVMQNKQKATEEQKPLIVTTLFPLEDWARVIGGEGVRVENIVPDGAEPHDYEPTAHDLRLLEQADVVIVVGTAFDEQLTQGLDPEKVVRFMDYAETQLAAPHEDDHGHKEGEVDPHVWLSFENMEKMVQVLGERLSMFVPEAPSNAQQYNEQLMRLEGEYRKGLARCQTANVIVAHDAFSYLGTQFGLKFHPIMGLSPEGEPNAQTLAQLAEEAKELGVTTVYFETLTNANVAKTLANEIGVTTAVLDPAEGLTPQARRQGQTFLGIMEQNLQSLRQGLRCL